jgi:pimeloyl-[acyl-carrier protein] synthase
MTQPATPSPGTPASHPLTQSPFVEQLWQNPYLIYAQSRLAGPVLWMEDLNRWFVLGHREAMAALRDTRLGNVDDAENSDFDDADCMRRRMLIQQAFSVTEAEDFRPRAARLTDAMLSYAADKGELELLDGFASPLALGVVSEVLGIPVENRPAIRTWVRSLSDSGIDPVQVHQPCDDNCAAAAATAPPEAVGQGLAELIAARRASPRDDLITQLVQAEQDGAKLADEEVLGLVCRLLVAGHDNTVNIIGNGIHALLDNPVELDRLRADPSLIGSAVEEFLRYDSPVQLITCHPSEDVDLCGQRLRRGQLVVVVIGAANRDPEAFADPDRLDITRNPNHHLSFSLSSHFCLGAPLARVETQVAIGMLVDRFPGLRLLGTPERRCSWDSRGFVCLPVAL